MAWNPIYALLLVFSTCIDYAAGMKIYHGTRKSRKIWLIASLISNFGMLFTFKYYGFFSREFNAGLTFLGVDLNIPEMDFLLPIGISFYTFQTVSYTLDIYFRKREPERNIFRLGLYVAFFPQAIAGPIERSTTLLPQLISPAEINPERIALGLRLMLWGFFKKLVIADRLGLTVDQVYGNPENFTGLDHLAATLFFAFQIYVDFSAYSEIAMGAAMLFGIQLMVNFDRPYLRTSIKEFWRHWHISLTTWFRDYVYQPLGGNRINEVVWIRNIFIVFLLSAIWHGANWTFVVWGVLHAGYFFLWHLAEVMWPRTGWAAKFIMLATPIKIGQWALTFTLVCLAWVFFRASSVDSAMYILTQILSVPGVLTLEGFWVGYNLVLISLLLLIEYQSGRRDKWLPVYKNSFPMRLGFDCALILAILLLGINTNNTFIYFQF
jgi:alginate O-acetyltransferase complex protein AlgI